MHKEQSLDNLIEYACQYLPEGWAIDIHTEKGSGSITVINPDGEEIPIENYDRLKFNALYAEAIKYCIEHK